MRRLSVFLVTALGACASDPAAGPTGKLDINVAPLSLPGVGRVCYDLEVDNGQGEVVWSLGVPGQSFAAGDAATVCSDRYGNAGGGDISYVGTCDANEPVHTVRLWIDTIADEGGNPLSDWRDPCPESGCAITATCSENADTPVEFNLVVMRRAQQGFFDIAVNFEDVFCSAKLDCTYDADGQQPIQLLSQPDGTRGQTAVIGFACTGGPGADGTVLHVSNVSVDCGAGDQQLIASISLATQDDGDVFGFNVIADPSLANESKLRLAPVAWQKTGASQWASSSELPKVPGYDSGQIVQRLDANHLYGTFFDVDTVLGGNGADFRGGLAVWQRVGERWQIMSTSAPPTGLEGFSNALVYGYDEALGRVFIGGPNATGIVAYWDIRSGHDAVTVAPFDESVGSCRGVAAGGDEVYFGCEHGLFVWQLDGGAGVVKALPLPFDPGDSYLYTAAASVRDNGDLVAYVTAPNGAQAAIAYWQRDGAEYGVTSLVSGDNPSFDELWASDDLLFSSADGASYLLRVLGPGAGNFDIWQAATIDGVESASWVLAGAASFGGQTLLYGWTHDGDATLPIVGLLPAVGAPIDFVTLPGGAGYALDAFGVRDGKVVLFGADQRFANERTVSRVWTIDAAVEGLVSDWRFLGDVPEGLGFPEVDVTWRPLRPVAALSLPVNRQPSRGWDLGASGEPGGTIAPADLPYPVATGGGGTSLTLDPTIVGNAWAVDPDPSDAVWQYQVSRGAEQLSCDGAPCNKLYWNTAVGFDATAAGCSLHFEATASDGSGFESGATPAATTYPYIAYDVQLTDDTGALVCRQNPLDAVPDATDGVRSVYTGLDAPRSFCHHFDGSSVSTSPGCE